MKLPAKNH